MERAPRFGADVAGAANLGATERNSAAWHAAFAQASCATGPGVPARSTVWHDAQVPSPIRPACEACENGASAGSAASFASPSWQRRHVAPSAANALRPSWHDSHVAIDGAGTSSPRARAASSWHDRQGTGCDACVNDAPTGKSPRTRRGVVSRPASARWHVAHAPAASSFSWQPAQRACSGSGAARRWHDAHGADACRSCAKSIAKSTRAGPATGGLRWHAPHVVAAVMTPPLATWQSAHAGCAPPDAADAFW